MSTLILIAAVAANGVIGKDNQLLWHLPEDMKHFKTLTQGHAVIMGRKTWESLPEKFRPLPGRHNIVITRNPAYKAAGATVVTSLDAAIAAAGDGDTYVIGGAEIYALALDRAQQLELTEVQADYAGDASFPEVDHNHWKEAARESHVTTDGLRFDFVTWLRR